MNSDTHKRCHDPNWSGFTQQRAQATNGFRSTKRVSVGLEEQGIFLISSCSAPPPLPEARVQKKK